MMNKIWPLISFALFIALCFTWFASDGENENSGPKQDNQEQDNEKPLDFSQTVKAIQSNQQAPSVSRNLKATAENYIELVNKLPNTKVHQDLLVMSYQLKTDAIEPVLEELSKSHGDQDLLVLQEAVVRHGLSLDLTKTFDYITTNSKYKSNDHLIKVVATSSFLKQPSLALDKSLKIKNVFQRTIARKSIVQIWVQMSAKDAEAYVERENKENVREQLKLAYVNGLAEKDIQKAISKTKIWLPKHMQNEAYQDIAKAWAKKDVASAIKWAKGLVDQKNRNSILPELIETYAKSEPEKAFSEYRKIKSRTIRERVCHGIFKEWAQQNLKKAKSNALLIKSEKEKISAVKVIVSYLIPISIEQAYQFAYKVKDNRSQYTYILQDIASNAAKQNIQSSLLWSNKLEEQDRDVAWVKILQHWSGVNFEQCFMWIERKDKQSTKTKLYKALLDNYYALEPGDVYRNIIKPKKLSDDSYYKIQSFFKHWRDLNPKEALENCLELKGRSEFSYAINGIAGSKQFQTFREATGLMNYAEKGRNKNGLAQAIVLAWIETDRDAVWQWAKSIEDNSLRKNTILSFINQFAYRDTNKVLAYYKELPKGFFDESNVYSLVQSLSRNNVTEGLQWLLDNEIKVSTSQLSNIGRQLYRENGEEALSKVLAIKNKKTKENLLMGIFRSMGKEDAERALNLVKKHIKGRDQKYTISNICYAWAAKKPKKALAWAEEHLTGETKTYSINQIVEVWTKHNLNEVIEWIEPVINDTKYKSSVSSMIRKWSYDNPEKALEFTERISSSTLKNELKNSIFSNWASKNPQAFADYLQKVPEGSVKRSSIENMVQSWSYKSPSAVADWLTKLPEGHRREAFVSKLVYTWGDKDPDAAWAWLKNMPEKEVFSIKKKLFDRWAYRDPVSFIENIVKTEESSFINQDQIRNVSRKWAGIDAGAAMKWAQSLEKENQKQTAIQSVLNTWAGKDPQAAAQWFDQHGHIGPRRLEVIRDLSREWAKKDHSNVMTWVNALQNPREKMEAIKSVIYGMARNHPEEASRMLDSIPSGQVRRDAISNLVSSWSSNDPEAASTWVMNLENNGERKSAIQQLASNWGNVNADRAIDWANQLQLPAEKNYALSNILSNIAYKDPVKASEYISNIPPSSQKNNIISTISRKWGDKNPKEAAAWALLLPKSNDRKSAFSNIFQKWAGSQPEEAGAYYDLNKSELSKDNDYVRSIVSNWAQVDGQKAFDWVNKLPKGSAKDKALGGLIETVSRYQPGQAAGFLEQMDGEGKNLSSSYYSIARNWSNYNPNDAVQWISQIDNKSNRVQYLKGIASGWGGSQPREALEWANRLEDEQTKQQLATTILSQWSNHDPQSAVQALESMNDDKIKTNAIDSLIRNWSESDLSGAANWLEALPKDSAIRDRGYKSIVSKFCYQEPATAAEYLVKIKPKNRKYLVRQVIQQWSQQDLEAAKEYSMQLEEGGGRKEAFGSIAESWSKIDFDSTSRWAEGLADDTAKSEVYKKMANYKVYKSKEETVNWLKNIPSSKARDAAIQSVIYRYSSRSNERADLINLIQNEKTRESLLKQHSRIRPMIITR